MYTSRERITAALEHRTLDRIPITEDFWPETINRWHKEGLHENVDVFDFLGIDRIAVIHPFQEGLSSAFPYEIYEETDEYRVDRNAYGVKVKYWKNRYATHVELEHSVKENKDWEKVKHVLLPSVELLRKESIETAAGSRQKGDFLALNVIEPFWFSFKMLGMENLCVQMKTDPDFIENICKTHMSFLMDMLEKTISSGIEWDAVWFFSDMAYKNGPMFSPEDYRRFFLPCHKSVSDFCRSHGKFLLLHSDGNIKKLIPSLIDAGFDALQPLEARAGNDIRDYKREFGRKICLFGNISADIIATGNRTAIEEEIKTKVTEAKKDGGYIFHSDHTIPSTVSFKDYCFALECAKSMEFIKARACLNSVCRQTFCAREFKQDCLAVISFCGWLRLSDFSCPGF